MLSTSIVYRAALSLLPRLAPAAGLVDAKLRRGHRARLETLDHFRAWSTASRRPECPLVWMHAPSVGEGLQAQAVLQRLRQRHPDWQLAYTFFSPSAEALAARMPVDVAGYLPYDTRSAVDQALGLLAPRLLVFTKLDLWPELATRAAARGILVALIAATVRPNSGRLRWPSRSLLAPGYRALSAAGAISEPDGRRLEHLGVPPERIEVLGDPRFDSVIDRVAAVAREDPLLRLGGGAPTLVAGSTWPGDEAVLLEAFHLIRAERPDARLILAPHEPSSERLAALERHAAQRSLPAPIRLGAAEGPAPFLLVDRVGVLATLYGAGTMAFVGGGFHRAGLHSVLEPAAWRLPVAFGPRWAESRDATLLIEAGAAEALPLRAPGARLQEVWMEWLRDTVRRQTQGERAYAVVMAGRGAADRSAALIERLVAGGS